MRLPRNVKLLRGPGDSVAMAGTLFLLWTVTLLHSSLVFPPGIRIQLPEAPGAWGETIPELTVAIDPAGRFHFDNQLVTEATLIARLRERTVGASTNRTLLLLSDRLVPAGTLTRLASIARSAGVREIVLATSPRPGANIDYAPPPFLQP